MGGSISSELKSKYKNIKIQSALDRNKEYKIEHYYTRLTIVNADDTWREAVRVQTEQNEHSEQELATPLVTPTGASKFKEINLLADHILSQLNLRDKKEISTATQLEVENLVDAGANKILIIGAPGIGKSTLMQYICYLWGNGKLWKDKFSSIWQVELKELAGWLKFKGDVRNGLLGGAYTYKDEKERYADFIYYSSVYLREKNSGIKSKITKASVVKTINSDKILLLLDGYDEIFNNNVFSQEIEIRGKKYSPEEFSDLLKSEASKIIETFDNVITTSRPNAVKEGHLLEISEGFTKIIENFGFDQDGRAAYINKYKYDNLDESEVSAKRQELISFIEHNPEVELISRVPLNVEILCKLWQNEDSRIKLRTYFSKTVLYNLIYESMNGWSEIKNTEFTTLNPEEKAKLGEFIMECAYQSINNKARDVEKIVIKKIVAKYAGQNQEEQKNFLTKLESLGFLYPVYRHLDRLNDHYFTHKSFQEYFAARYLEILLKKEEAQQKKAIEFIRTNKYKPYYLEVFKFLSGILAHNEDENKEKLLEVFWRSILTENNSGADEVGGGIIAPIASIGGKKELVLLMHLLSQVKYDSEVDNVWIVKQVRNYLNKRIENDLFAWEKELAESHYNLHSFIKSLSEKLRTETDTYQIIKIIRILSNIDKSYNFKEDGIQDNASAHSMAAVDAISDRLEDQDVNIAEEAIYALGKIAYYREDTVKKLLAKVDSDNFRISVAAIKVMSKIGYSDSFLTKLVEKLNHQNPWIVLSSIDAINRIEHFIDKEFDQTDPKNKNKIEILNQVINGLVGCLTSQSWKSEEITEASLRLLEKFHKSRDFLITQALAQLSLDIETTRNAIDILGNIGRDTPRNKEITKILINQKLKGWAWQKISKDDLVSYCKVIRALGNIGHEIEVANVILENLYHPNIIVVSTSTESFIKMASRYPNLINIEILVAKLKVLQTYEKGYERHIISKAFGTMARILPTRLLNTDSLLDVLLNDYTFASEGAAKAIGEMARSRADLININVLEAKLGDEDFKVSRRAGKALVEIAESRADLIRMDMLQRMLDCYDLEITEVATEMFVKIAESRADLIDVNVLMAIVDRGYPKVRVVRAIEIVVEERIGLINKKVVKALVEKFKDSHDPKESFFGFSERKYIPETFDEMQKREANWMSKVAVTAFGEIAEKRTSLIYYSEVAIFVERLYDSNYDVQKAALQAFEKIAKTKLLTQPLVDEMLAKLDYEDTKIQIAILNALGKIAKAKRYLLTKALVDAIVAKLDHNDINVQVVALKAFEEVTKSQPTLVNMDVLVDKLNHEVCLVQVAALEVFGEIAKVRAGGLLTKVLVDSLTVRIDGFHEVSNTVDALADALGEVAKVRSDLINIDALAEKLLDENEKVSYQAEKVFIKILESGANLISQPLVKMLLNMLEDSKSEVRKMAVTVIEKIVESHADLISQPLVDMLLRKLEDSDTFVRDKAVDIIGKIDEFSPIFIGLDATNAMVKKISTYRVEYATTHSFGKIAKANSELITSTEINSLLTKFSNFYESYSAIKAIGKIVEVRVDLINMDVLVAKLSDFHDDSYRSAAGAIGEIAKARGELITPIIVDALILTLGELFTSSMDAFKEIAKARPDLITPSVLNGLATHIYYWEESTNTLIEVVKQMCKQDKLYIIEYLLSNNLDKDLQNITKNCLDSRGFFSKEKIANLLLQLLSQNNFTQKRAFNLLLKIGYKDTQLNEAFDYVVMQKTPLDKIELIINKFQDYYKKSKQINNSEHNINIEIESFLESAQHKFKEVKEAELSAIIEERKLVQEYLTKDSLNAEEQKFIAEHIIRNHYKVKFYRDKINIEGNDYFVSTDISQSLLSMFNSLGMTLMVDEKKPVMSVKEVSYSNLKSVVDESQLEENKWKLTILRNKDKALILLESIYQANRKIESINEDLSEHITDLDSLQIRKKFFAGFVGKDYMGVCYYSTIDIENSQKEALVDGSKEFSEGQKAFEEKENDINDRYKKLIFKELNKENYKKLHLDKKYDQFRNHNQELHNHMLLGITFEEATRLKFEDHDERIETNSRKLTELEQELKSKLEKDIKKLNAELNRNLEERKKQQDQDNEKNQETIKEINSTIEQQQKQIAELQQQCKEFPKILELSEKYDKAMSRFDEKLSEQDKKLLAIEKIRKEFEEYKSKVLSIEEQLKSEKREEELESIKSELINLKQDAAHKQLIIESILEITKEHGEQLMPLVAEMESQQTRNEELRLILNDPYKKAFYNHLVQQLNSVWLASSVVNTDIVACQKSGIISHIGNAVTLISTYIPLVGIAVGLCGELLKKFGNKMEREKISRFLELVPNPILMGKISDLLARKLIDDIEEKKLDTNEIETPKTFQEKLRNLFEFVVENVEEIINFVESDAHAQEIKLLTEGGKQLLSSAKQVLAENIDANRKESIRSILTNEGKKHAGIIATIMIAKVYNGEASSSVKEANTKEDKATILEELVMDEYGVIPNEIKQCAEEIAHEVMSKIKKQISFAEGDKYQKREDKFKNKLIETLLSRDYYRNLLAKALDTKNNQLNKEVLIKRIFNAFIDKFNAFIDNKDNGQNKLFIQLTNNKTTFKIISNDKVIASCMRELVRDVINSMDLTKEAEGSPTVISRETANVYYSDQVEYDMKNLILYQDEMLFEAAKTGGLDRVNSLIELCEDQEVAIGIIEAANKYGINHVLSVIFDKLSPSIGNTEDKRVSLVADCNKRVDNYFLENNEADSDTPKGLISPRFELDFDWQWYAKRIIYMEELKRFKAMIINNNIYESIDAIRYNSAFKKAILFKLYPDMGDDHEDFVFVRELEEKLNKEPCLQQMIDDMLQYMQPFIYKAGLVFKSIDLGVDAVRLINEPNIENSKKTIFDFSYLHSMYSGLSANLWALSAIDITYKCVQGEYYKALSQLANTAIYATLPTALAFTGVPHSVFIYSSIMTVYTGYYTINNLYSLYLEYNSIDWQLKSAVAYRDLYEFFANSRLQQVYDFASIHKKYDIKVNSIELKIEKTQIRHKLEEKVELADKLLSIPMLEEKHGQSEFKYFSLTVGEQHNEHCISFVKNESKTIADSYICQNIEQETIMGHSVTGKDGIIHNLEQF